MDAYMRQRTLDELAGPGAANGRLVGALRLGPEAEAGPIGKKEIQEAAGILAKYKLGKANLERRIVDDELWYKQRHWEVIRRTDRVRKACGCLTDKDVMPEPASGWLFNAILNKHADAMDNYPEAVVLPRERTDEQSAKILSSVLPVVMELNDFEQVYSDAWWEKLKHGTAAYGVFWDSTKENGLGDIAIKEVDLLKLFWEPGINDIQKSRNFFCVDLVDNDVLEQQYPRLKGKLKGDVIDVAQYLYDDAVDTSEKSVVVDWYYKRQSPEGRTLVHYAKFVGDTLLYASENEPDYAQRGFYDHGLYPFVFDVLFPEEGSPVGFGYVAICKDPQLYIDKLYSAILDRTIKSTKPRFFAATSTGVNEEEFLDWSRPLVHVEGTLDDTRIRQIELGSMGGDAINVLQLKIDEMKDTAANRDVNSGGTGAGVTAASAIAALQEAGNKASRDMIAASYRSYVKLGKLCIELMRQFYDERRSFRVTGPTGVYEFVEFSNQLIAQQPIGVASDGVTELYRLPVFDLKISAQKKNPFSRMESNERAMELYAAGFFNPERAQEALGALEMMNFEGIEKVRERVEQGQTLLNLLNQAMAAMQAVTGAAPMGGEGAPAAAPGGTGQAPQVPQGQTVSDGIMASRTPRSGYTERLVSRSRPSVEAR